MLVLILLLVFGIGVAYFALQNTTVVTLTLAQYSFSNVPLFLVMVGSVLAGVLAAYVIYLASSISSTLTIHGKDKKLKEDEKQIAELTRQLHQTEIENTQLKKENGVPLGDDKSL